MIFEPSSQGHRLQYVRSVLDALADYPVSRLFVTARGMQETAEFATHLSPIAGTFGIDEIASQAGEGSPRMVGMRRFSDLRKAIGRHRPEHVYVPYADGLMQISGLASRFGGSLARQGMEIEGLLMRGRFAYSPEPVSMPAHASIKALEWSPFDIVHHLDPIVHEFLRGYSPTLAAKLRLLPEAVEHVKILPAKLARERLGIPTHGRYIGALGALFAGKGIALLLKAFVKANLAADTRLLLVGIADAPLLDLLREDYAEQVRSSRIIHIARYVSQDEFHLGLNASDLICVPHLHQTGSSGLVVRAAAARRPILGTDFGWIGRVIRAFHLGEVCDVENIAAFAASLSEVVNRTQAYNADEHALQFAAFHSIGNFGAHWTQRLRERLRITTPSSPIGWHWPQSAHLTY